MKKIVNIDLINHNEMSAFLEQLKSTIETIENKGLEADVQYSYNSVGNFFSALILSRKDVD